MLQPKRTKFRKVMKGRIKGAAKGMEIPVVNSERFLDLIGFVPSKLAKAG